MKNGIECKTHFKNEIASKKNLWYFLLFFAIILTSCSPSDDRKNINLALKVDNKTYLLSSLGAFITETKLKNNESPPIIKSTRIVEVGGELFVEPSCLENIVNLISGNYILYDYKEKSFDGYVTERKYDVYDKKYSTESTEKIGEMLSITNIYLSDTAQTKELHISWQRTPNQKPLKNCLEMSLWIDCSYKPGTTTVALEKYIMIELNKIVEFYDYNIIVDYIAEDEILYVIVN
ncbi:MAG: hypothetical protein HQ565_05375 [Bacteroidetes bacterium]|nr:hypothetical protein [Bacteroidota bacterium]